MSQLRKHPALSYLGSVVIDEVVAFEVVVAVVQRGEHGDRLRKEARKRHTSKIRLFVEILGLF